MNKKRPCISFPIVVLPLNNRLHPSGYTSLWWWMQQSLGLINGVLGHAVCLLKQTAWKSVSDTMRVGLLQMGKCGIVKNLWSWTVFTLRTCTILFPYTRFIIEANPKFVTWLFLATGNLYTHSLLGRQVRPVGQEIPWDQESHAFH